MCVCPEVCAGEVRGQCLLEQLEGCGHLDVLTSLQSLLALDKVVDTVDHSLHQLDLMEGCITLVRHTQL